MDTHRPRLRCHPPAVQTSHLSDDRRGVSHTPSRHVVLPPRAAAMSPVRTHCHRLLDCRCAGPGSVAAGPRGFAPASARPARGPRHGTRRGRRSRRRGYRSGARWRRPGGEMRPGDLIIARLNITLKTCAAFIHICIGHQCPCGQCDTLLYILPYMGHAAGLSSTAFRNC